MKSISLRTSASFRQVSRLSAEKYRFLCDAATGMPDATARISRLQSFSVPAGYSDEIIVVATFFDVSHNSLLKK